MNLPEQLIIKRLMNIIREQRIIIDDLIIENQYLEKQEQNFPLRLWQAIEYLNEDNKKYFSSVDLVELNLIKSLDDTEEINVKMKIHPKNIVCIKSQIGNGRGKVFYIKSEITNNIEIYRANKNKLSFEKLISELDKLNHHLAVVSKNSIVNVEYYSLIANYLVVNNGVFSNSLVIPKHRFSFTPQSQKLKNDFILIQDGFKFQCTLQKKLFGYMSHHGIK